MKNIYIQTSNSTDKPAIAAKDMIRTSSTDQKLDKFLTTTPSVSSSSSVSHSTNTFSGIKFLDVFCREFNGWTLACSSWGRWSESTRIFSKTLWLELPLRLTVWFHSLGWIKVGHLPHPGLGQERVSFDGNAGLTSNAKYRWMSVRAWSSYQKYSFTFYS